MVFDERRSAGGLHANRMRAAASRVRARIFENPSNVFLIKDGVTLVGLIRHLENRGARFELLAVPAGPGLPRFRIYPEGLKSFASKIFGAHDIEVGHAGFDKRFMVQGEDHDLVRQVLTRERCDLMLAHFHDSELRCTGGELRLLRPAWYAGLLIGTNEYLDRSIGFMFDVGAADVFGRGLLVALPGATLHRVLLPFVVIDAPAEIRVGFARDSGTLTTHASAVVPHQFTIPPEILGRAHSLGAVATLEPSKLILAWPDVVRDAHVLRAAVELLRGLVTGPREGVFR